MSNPPIPPLPFPDKDRATDEDAPDAGESPTTVERDGERTIDPDIADDQVDSAEADRVASGADAEEDAL